MEKNIDHNQTSDRIIRLNIAADDKNVTNHLDGSIEDTTTIMAVDHDCGMKIRIKTMSELYKSDKQN